ncbi:hypothetical protein [Facklamia miroungae]|uniref:1,4-dihydroxy-2-naphthoate octaprenyltransferase n=1 Tax=Facklamia miroungae TaxID=120956 RepID=A0A1G7UQM6_9LACT|nr:hypothetical protein [Facklamia miroungae]NKZ30158.1 hypothetical protein [Facklamia miroungae]SDG49915.1 hypothetical protein SAMN05421791_11142 [Facklamia miroungae]
MNTINNILKHPLMQLVGYPLSWIGFGLVTAIFSGKKVDWLDLILLVIIVILSHLVNHYNFYHHIQRDPKANSPILYYLLLAGLIASSLFFMSHQHYIINVLLGIFVIVTAIQYQFIPLVRTIYHSLLNIYFTGFLLNVIAYYSQANTLTNKELISFIPIVVLMTGLEINQQYLKGTFNLNFTKKYIPIKITYIVFFLFIVATCIGVYTSLPSQSYYLLQILFFCITFTTALPSLIPVRKNHRIQNKLNYQGALSLIFIIFYSLSYLF